MRKQDLTMGGILLTGIAVGIWLGVKTFNWVVKRVPNQLHYPVMVEDDDYDG